ncbi:hypothetical protein QYM36_017130 [Artemia franciscana]|uniref:Uncharacterized protein n=2 Tax=Artemia franciscana TaxID=6661 RepID=A0AA88H7C6_ARTSF|nr:hypothetical protein QYM36_017130 [Artemia franciscana]KAK2704973.1 hypothetical protein QYM36_017130 [Artemia franciscana]KAK2704974.1 hypothetical protein QYM36_017130 [Artemia franciscana]
MYSLSRVGFQRCFKICQSLSCYSFPASSRTYASSDKIEDDKPVKFSASKAASWTGRQSISGGAEDPAPWFQTYVVCLSMAVFLTYFLYLREENDVDDFLQRSIYDHVPGLEKPHLETALKYNKQYGLETEAIEKRLEEIDSEANIRSPK